MRKDFIFQVHITDSCGLNCGHCYIGDMRLDHPVHMEMEVFNRLVDQIIDMTDHMSNVVGNEIVPVVHLTGGNPINHPQFWEFVSLLNTENIKTGILGNPVSKETLRRLKDFGVISYQISIDGFDHDAIRGKGQFEKSISFLSDCKTLQIKSFVMMNVSNDNVNQVSNFYDYLSSSKLPYGFAFARIVKQGNANKYNVGSNEISPFRYRELFEKIYSTSKNSSVKLIMKDPLWSLYLWENNLLDVYKDMIHGGCGAGITILSVDINGDISPCRRMGIKSGNVSDSSLWEIYATDEAINHIRNKDSYEECKNCELFNHCRGCPALGGKGYIDPQCWKNKEKESK